MFKLTFKIPSQFNINFEIDPPADKINSKNGKNSRHFLKLDIKWYHFVTKHGSNGTEILKNW